MELGEYLATLRKGWLVIVVLAVLCGGLGYAQAAAGTPTYRSSSTVYVTLAHGETISELNQGATYAQSLVESFVQLATMPAVLEPVIEDLGLDATPRGLKGAIQADSPLNTSLIEISAVSADPQRAADLANGVAASLAETVADLSPTTSAGAASLKMTVVAEAEPSAAPFSPAPRRDAAAGVGVGLVLGVLVALLRAQLDTRVRTTKDLPGAPTRVALGQVPLDRTLVKHPRTLLQNPHSPLAESYRRLAANLQFLDASKPLRTIVVSSATPGEGKSTTAVNLAIVMAEKRSRVLLVDADLRSPSIADICGIEGAAGLSSVLGTQATIDEVVQEWGVPGLYVVAAGQIPPNPSQLVDSPAMDAFLAAVTESYDLVIIDTPPLLALTDGAVLARKTDGAVVVARSKKISRPRLAEALASLDALGATCLGLLLNGVPTPRSELRYGYGHVAKKRTFGRSRRPEPPPSAARSHRGPRTTGPVLPTRGAVVRGTEGTDAETTSAEVRSGTHEPVAPSSPDIAGSPDTPGSPDRARDTRPNRGDGATPDDGATDVGADATGSRGPATRDEDTPTEDDADHAAVRDGDDAGTRAGAETTSEPGERRAVDVDDLEVDDLDADLDEDDADAGRAHRHVAALSGATPSTSSRVAEPR